MRINRLWLVRDPSPVSVLADIVFETDPIKIANYIRGCLPAQWVIENHAMYTDEGEAMADARARLAARQPCATAAAPTVTNILGGRSR